MAQQDISPKNTKNEILEAYQELLKQVDKTSQESYQDTKKMAIDIVIKKALPPRPKGRRFRAYCGVRI